MELTMFWPGTTVSHATMHQWGHKTCIVHRLWSRFFSDIIGCRYLQIDVVFSDEYMLLVSSHNQLVSLQSLAAFKVAMEITPKPEATSIVVTAFPIAGTLGCVFIDNETHETGVTKCTTGEAWSAFSWHHSSVFRCSCFFFFFRCSCFYHTC